MFDGEGEVFTSDSFVHKVQEIQTARKAKADEKARKADAKRRRKEAVEAVEREWLRIKEQHEAALHAWEEERQQMAHQKVPKRNWPKKPVRPRKPALPLFPEANDDGDEEDEEQDEEEMNV